MRLVLDLVRVHFLHIWASSLEQQDSEAEVHRRGSLWQYRVNRAAQTFLMACAAWLWLPAVHLTCAPVKESPLAIVYGLAIVLAVLFVYLRVHSTLAHALANERPTEVKLTTSQADRALFVNTIVFILGLVAMLAGSWVVGLAYRNC